MIRPSTQARLDDALTRLLAGQPTVTDGALTVRNLCQEAGVGRDAYYRADDAFKQKFAQARDNRDAHQPEVVHLREQIRQLKRAETELRRDHTQTVRALEETIRTYANQIQVLALHSAELQAENDRLRQAMEVAAEIPRLGAHTTGHDDGSRWDNDCELHEEDDVFQGR
ncbi:hypothetical protein ACWDBD_32495 [Streptomyces sp. NPDC001118]